MLACEAQYFGEGQEPPLFGILQQTGAMQARDELVLICYPAPQEMMRSYWAHRQMAQELAKAGTQSFRFDYFGTGDSLGSTAMVDLARWQADIVAAYRHLRVITRSSKISVIGTRLGATLACQALADIAVQRLILWDPIASGARYLSELEISHQSMLQALFDRHLTIDEVARKEELLGFPFPLAARTQIQELAWTWPQKAKAIHILSSDPKGTAQLEAELAAAALPPSHIPLQFHACADPMLWQDPMALKMQAFPQHMLQMVARIMEGPIG